METIMVYKNGIEREVNTQRLQEYLDKGYVLKEILKNKPKAKKV
ncbi:MAG: hypothetical protein RSE24_03790 [Oscillospiraceae bacterium]